MVCRAAPKRGNDGVRKKARNREPRGGEFTMKKASATGPGSSAAREQNLDDITLAGPRPGFVTTPEVASITTRALTYLRAAHAVHFAGPPGVGKTSLALHVAGLLGAPIVLLQGDDDLASADLVGREAGLRRSRVLDNFVRSVTKETEEMLPVWVASRLTIACQYGYTLVYDEFNRSRPETNNALLSVLAEGILRLPRPSAAGTSQIAVHPSFRAIFTSNPEEYAGVHKAPDALVDRIITLELDHHDRNTEIEIVASRAGVGKGDAGVIVDIVRALRGHTASGARPTLRAALSIARVVQTAGARVHADDEVFRWACRDVTTRDFPSAMRGARAITPPYIDETVTEVCLAHGAGGRESSRANR
jgi:nitric oxide reductase NorQ protein